MRSVAEIFSSHEVLDDNGRHINGTDKHGPNHRYGDAYDHIFGAVRVKATLVMEIGVADGSSLLAWREVFPYATVVGMDIHHSDKAHGDRIEFHLGDQRSLEDCRRAAAGRKFDVIVEDATHRLEDSLVTLLYLWPYIKPGGFYVIEEFANVGALRDNIAQLWPSAEVVDTVGPSGGVEPLVVLRKPKEYDRCQNRPGGEQCGREYGHEGKCVWARGD